jgi:hypothetical protein
MNKSSLFTFVFLATSVLYSQDVLDNSKALRVDVLTEQNNAQETYVLHCSNPIPIEVEQRLFIVLNENENSVASLSCQGLECFLAFNENVSEQMKNEVFEQLRSILGFESYLITKK